MYSIQPSATYALPSGVILHGRAAAIKRYRDVVKAIISSLGDITVCWRTFRHRPMNRCCRPTVQYQSSPKRGTRPSTQCRLSISIIQGDSTGASLPTDSPSPGNIRRFSFPPDILLPGPQFPPILLMARGGVLPSKDDSARLVWPIHLLSFFFALIQTTPFS